MADNCNTPSSRPVIQVKELRKTFGVLEAVAGISFELPKGAFLTIFGPNGAGKTTLIKILSGLTRPTHGSAWVAGFDVLKGESGMRREIELRPRPLHVADHR